MNFSKIISPVILEDYVKFWVKEDIPNFDLSTLIADELIIEANVELKEDGVIAGFPFCDAVCQYFDTDINWKVNEGDYVTKCTTVGIVKGPRNKVLMAERTLLNILCRASGVATISRFIKNKLSDKWNGQISGNRKTTPGFRVVEKYAMYVGGITTHRYDLSGMVMLKDNHLRSNKQSITMNIEDIRNKIGKFMKIEIEVENIKDALEAARNGVDIVMLDNFNSKDIKSVAKQIKDINKSVLVEASGGITEANIIEYAVENIDIISSSIFSQGYKCLDMSINFINETGVKNTGPIPINVNKIAANSKDNEVKLTNSTISTCANQTPATDLSKNISNLSTVQTTESNNNSSLVDKTKPDLKRKLEEAKEAAIKSSNLTPAKQVNNDSIVTTKKVTPQNKVTPPNNKPVNPGLTNLRNQQNNSNNQIRNKPRNSFDNNHKTTFPGYPVPNNNINNGNSRQETKKPISNPMPLLTGMSTSMMLRPVGFSSAQSLGFGSINGGGINPPIKYGGNPRTSLMLADTNQPKFIRPVTNNTFFCNRCLIQNPTYGPPFCGKCRSPLK